MKKIKFISAIFLLLGVMALLVACKTDTPPSESTPSAQSSEPSVSSSSSQPPQAESYVLTFATEDALKGSVSAKKVDESQIVSGSTLARGTSVILTATPNSGYTFLGWYDGENPVSTFATYPFILSSDISLTAKFTLNSHTLTFTVDGVGGAAVEESGIQSGDSVSYGTSVTLVATPDTGYSFLGWFDGGTLPVTVNERYTFEMEDEARALTAKFSANAYKLTYDINDAEGTISNASHASQANVPFGESVSLTAQAKTGYTFLGWHDGVQIVSTDSVYSFQMGAKELSLTAQFSRNSYSLEYTVNADMGEVLKGNTAIGQDGKVLYGDEVILIARAKSGYRFVGWHDGTATVSTDETYIFNMGSRALTLEAQFEAITYQVTFSANENEGSVEPGASLPSNGEVAHGTSVTLTASAKSGYIFDAWYENNTPVSYDAQYTFTVTGARSLEARFKKDSFVLTYDYDSARGSVSYGNTVIVGGKVEFGAQVTLTATPLEGYDFDGWYEGTQLAESSETFAFTMSASARSLEARFKPEKRTVTFVDGLDIVHTQTLDYNTTATSYSVSLPNHSFLGWFVSNAEDAAKFSFDTPITESIVLYTKWKADIVLHDVEFIYEDGRRITLQQVADGNVLQMPGYESRVGYDFDAWYYYDDTLDEYTEVPSGYEVRASMTVKAVYVPKLLDVKFYENKGDATPYHSESIEYGKLLTTPKTPTSDTHIFIMWVDENGQRFEFGAALTESINLYGQWQEKPKDIFNVDFYKNKEDIPSGEYEDRVPVESGKTLTLPSAPTKDGARFLGWYYDNGTESELTEETVISSNMSVYAKYETLTYKVTFYDYDGATILKAEQTVNWGESAVAPDEPERTGYDFDGWDTAFDNVTRDLTVKAKWKAESYKITFMDGDSKIDELSADFGTTLAVPKTPEKAGYSFIGWYTDEDLDTRFDFAKTAVSGELTIYARFDLIVIERLEVVFQFINGDVISEQLVVDGNPAIAPGNPTMKGHTFRGWDKSFDSISEDTVITAQFDKNEYTVRFFDYNGALIGTAQTVEYQGYAAAPENSSVPCPANKQFLGWDKNVGDPIEKDTDFHAQYAFETRDVTFFVDGEEYSKITVEYGSRANIPNTPSVAGYKFKYWRLEGANEAFDFSSEITESIELHAELEHLVDVWVVTFKSPSGEQVGNVQLVANNGKAMEPAPYSDGTSTAYVWCLEGTQTPFEFDTTEINNDIVLVAVAQNS